jgi:hypothetical protein
MSWPDVIGRIGRLPQTPAYSRAERSVSLRGALGAAVRCYLDLTCVVVHLFGPRPVVIRL